MLSNYEATSAKRNLSVKYTNLYVIDGQITYLSLVNIELPYVNKCLNGYQWRPMIKVVTQEEANQIAQNVEEELSLCLLNDNLWYGNIGHALWDGIYPIYHAAVKFGYTDEDFHYFASEMDNQNTLAYGAIKTFCGGSIYNHPRLSNKLIKLNTLIAGTGVTGNVVMTRYYTLSNTNDALRKFRDRMFKRYDLTLEKPKNFNIIFVHNKRYSQQEHENIQSFINVMPSLFDIKYIDWSKYSFKEQMEIIKDVDIQITGPGTGMMYMPFMKDGSVNINLGYMESTQTNTARPNIKIPNREIDFQFPAFMEQSVCNGANYVSTLYYDRYKFNNLEVEPLSEILFKAIKLINNNEKTENNLNIDAQIFVEYCNRENILVAEELCNYLTGKAFFIELFINEHPFAIPDFVNLDLLREIKKEFNYNRKYEYT